jgi:flagellar hook assembly protein FlgD
MPVSASDGLTSVPNGFTEGHLLTVRYYREGKEYTSSLELLNDSKQLFAKGESMFVRMKAAQTTGIDPFAQSDEMSVKCYPNPFSEQVTIEIELPKPGDLKVEVFDSAGRLIETLYKGDANQKESLIWDGIGQNGMKMPSGTYLLKVNDLFVKVILSK